MNHWGQVKWLFYCPCGLVHRIFTKKLLDNKLSEFYILFMSEMEKGFSKIMVDTDEEVEKVKDLLKFMCIYPYVEVEKNK